MSQNRNKFVTVAKKLLMASIVSNITLATSYVMLYISKVAFEFMFGGITEFAEGGLHFIMFITLIATMVLFFIIVFMNHENTRVKKCQKDTLE